MSKNRTGLEGQCIFPRGSRRFDVLDLKAAKAAGATMAVVKGLGSSDWPQIRPSLRKGEGFPEPHAAMPIDQAIAYVLQHDVEGEIGD